MSYLDYYLKSLKKDESQEAEKKQRLKEHNKTINKNIWNSEKRGALDVEKIRGSCHTMCPIDEGRLRIREKMVHILEKCTADMKLVKSYSRSAADSNMAVPQNLRPFNILRVTVAYLLFEVSQRTDVSTHIVYDFINDRLRAVRQDMTVQRLSHKECAHLLEPMIRFYVYYGYRLFGLPLNDFDPALHKKYLLECLKWFLSCCDNTHDLKDYSSEHLTPSDLGDLMTTMDIDHGNNQLAFDQVLMECLYILCNLDDVHPLRRYVSLPRNLKRNVRLRLSYSLAVANRKGNFVKVTSMLNELCPLSYCALCQYLPEIQRRAIEVLTLAYSNKKFSVPSAIIKKWLAFSSDAEAMEVCQHYGLPVEGSSIRFDKGMLKTDAKIHQPKIRLLPCERLNLNFLHILTYTGK